MEVPRLEPIFAGGRGQTLMTLEGLQNMKQSIQWNIEPFSIKKWLSNLAVSWAFGWRLKYGISEESIAALRSFVIKSTARGTLPRFSKYFPLHWRPEAMEGQRPPAIYPLVVDYFHPSHITIFLIVR